MEKTYIKSQFKRLVASETNKASVQINGGHFGATNRINVTPKQLEAIKGILLKG